MTKESSGEKGRSLYQLFSRTTQIRAAVNEMSTSQSQRKWLTPRWSSWSRRYQWKSETNEARRMFLRQREISRLKVHATVQRRRDTAGCSHVTNERPFLCVRAFDLELRCVAINPRAGRYVTTSRIYMYLSWFLRFLSFHVRNMQLIRRPHVRLVTRILNSLLANSSFFFSRIVWWKKTSGGFSSFSSCFHFTL